MRAFTEWMLAYRPRCIVNVSGGKDSAATALRALEVGLSFRLIMADADNEHPEAYETAHRLAAHCGVPLEMVKADFAGRIAKNREYVATVWREEGVSEEIVLEALSVLHPTGNAYLDLCMWKGRFPSRKAQFCTEELKQIPVDEQIIGPAAKQPGVILHWMGVRKNESERRARLDPCETYWPWPNVIIYRPILNWTVEKVFAIHKKHGFPPNPLYSQGMSRVGCMPCINCAKDELRQIAARFPEHVAKIRRWEELVALASKRRMATFFPSVTIPGNKDVTPTREKHGIDAVVEWSKTSRGGVQYDLVTAAADPAMCSSKYGLCE